jgi:hypothetical protein
MSDIECTKCGETKGRDSFYNHKAKKNGKSSHCKSCTTTGNRSGRSSPSRLLGAARQRSRKSGVECTITSADIVIPTYCPALGIKLKAAVGVKSNRDLSPSLDRIDPSKGYVPGNVQVTVTYRSSRTSPTKSSRMRRGTWYFVLVSGWWQTICKTGE